MLLSSDKLVIMKIITCALVIIFIITRLSDDNITLPELPGDKVPQPLAKHLSSVESVGKYDAEEGKHAA